MPTHDEARRIEYIAKDIDSLARDLETEAKRLRDFTALMRDIEGDGGDKPLTTVEKFNIRSNVRRMIFGPMRSAGYAVSVETLLHSLDRFIEDEG